MKCFAMFLLMGVMAAASSRCNAETSCARVAVQSDVTVAKARLTLADLLGPGSCEGLRQEASRAGLGTAPVGGRVRVFNGHHIRELLGKLSGDGLSLETRVSMQIPERVTVHSAQAAKSCAEFAKFVANAAPAGTIASSSRGWRERMDCAAAPNLAEATPLELTKTSWSAVLHRWEFNIRCARPQDCVPFLLWSHQANVPRETLASERARILAGAESNAIGNGSERLVRRGQTVTLIWDQRGIRIVLPVTCLDGGGLGQFVRVQFKNTPRILQAEVLADGTLRASL